VQRVLQFTEGLLDEDRLAVSSALDKDPPVLSGDAFSAVISRSTASRD
jgi:hypothetical protein